MQSEAGFSLHCPLHLHSPAGSAMLNDLFHTAETNDRQSFAATLIDEAEKNKLSSVERSWLAGTL